MNRNEKKSIRQFTASERSLGKTDQEIYESLKAKYSDKKAIAKLIAGLATPERSRRFIWMAHLVSALLIVFCGYYIYLYATIPPSAEHPHTAGLIIGILPFLAITAVFIVTLYQYYVEDSRSFIIGFFWIFLFNRLLKRALAEETTVAIALIVLILVVTVIYNRKKYPSYGITGPRRDENGEYIL